MNILDSSCMFIKFDKKLVISIVNGAIRFGTIVSKKSQLMKWLLLIL